MPPSEAPALIIKHFDELQDYQSTYQNMLAFTKARNPQTTDEFWCLQHHSVFTLGQAGKPEHILQSSDIPIVQSDRGGQVTYHGPGQWVIYALCDLRRLGIGARDFVTNLELSMVDCLAAFGIESYPKKEAPGVYTTHQQQEAKIGALGLRVKSRGTYHGLSLNIDMDLSPFSFINPCGYQGLQVTQMADFIDKPDFDAVKSALIAALCKRFGYTSADNQKGVVHER